VPATLGSSQSVAIKKMQEIQSRVLLQVTEM
jgi:hypothetical protein